MDRRRFIIIGAAGSAWFVALNLLYNRFGPQISSRRVHVEDYLLLGERAALEAITSNGDFYVTSKGSSPRVDPAQWRLALNGLVENPLTLTLEQIKALPQLERTLTLECISNRVGGPWIGNARWRGTALRPLLEMARPRAEATAALLHAADGLSTGLPLERLFWEDNFLAYEMNGEPLPRDHGYPLRVFFPGKYGMKQPKWITGIEFLAEHQLGYWERKGWSDTAERQTRGVIDNPGDGANLSGERFLLAGYAVADASGIERVEVSEDNRASWRSAEIVSNPSPYVWTFWRYEWQPLVAGSHTLWVRAVNGRGEVQTAEEADPWPEGATGHHRIEIKVALESAG